VTAAPAGISVELSSRTRDDLARDMIEVHGADAAGVARSNARAAALAGQAPQARDWLKLVEIIQRRVARPALSPLCVTHGPA